MKNSKSELKTALINKEKIENLLSGLEKLRSKPYVGDELHTALKSEYVIFIEHAEILLSNLETLKIEQTVTEDQYNALKSEYILIKEHAENLLANKSEASINEDQYKTLKSEYDKKLSDLFLEIARIKADIKGDLVASQNELSIAQQEFQKVEIKFKIGETSQNEFNKVKQTYENKINRLQISVSELNKLVNAESPKDIGLNSSSLPIREKTPNQRSGESTLDEISDLFQQFKASVAPDPDPAINKAPRNKIVSVLLALFLGSFGAHKFYLGRKQMGIVYLLLCWTSVPFFISLIEAVQMATMSDQAFHAQYG